MVRPIYQGLLLPFALWNPAFEALNKFPTIGYLARPGNYRVFTPQ